MEQRTHLTLMFVVETRRVRIGGISPSVKEVFNYLNTVLEQRLGERPALVSHEQVFRIITKLRHDGYLFDPKLCAELRGVHRNLIPTPQGDTYVREHLREEEDGEIFRREAYIRDQLSREHEQDIG